MTTNLYAQFTNYFIIQPDLILFFQGHMLQKLELLVQYSRMSLLPEALHRIEVVP